VRKKGKRKKEENAKREKGREGGRSLSTLHSRSLLVSKRDNARGKKKRQRKKKKEIHPKREKRKTGRASATYVPKKKKEKGGGSQV